MSVQEMEAVIAALQAEVADLKGRVADLEGTARQPAGEAWGFEPMGDPYADAEVIQS